MPEQQQGPSPKPVHWFGLKCPPQAIGFEHMAPSWLRLYELGSSGGWLVVGLEVMSAANGILVQFQCKRQHPKTPNSHSGSSSCQSPFPTRAASILWNQEPEWSLLLLSCWYCLTRMTKVNDSNWSWHCVSALHLVLRWSASFPRDTKVCSWIHENQAWKPVTLGCTLWGLKSKITQ